MHDGEPRGLDDDYLALIHQVLAAYEASGDAFERARLVSALGKTHAPRLLEEVERLQTEVARLNAWLGPLTELISDGGVSSDVALDVLLADISVKDAVRAALGSVAARDAERGG
jgi:hypothetical protein